MFAAVLDTSVLWPSLQRDFLLSLATERAYRAQWSNAILDELEYHEAAKLINRHNVPEIEAQNRARRLIEQMSTAFDDASVTGWEPLEGSYDLPDPDDEHVVAAAVVGGAEVIVTENLKHFPADKLPAPIRALPAREFAYDTVRQHLVAASRAVLEISVRSGRRGTLWTPNDVLDNLVIRYGWEDVADVLSNAPGLRDRLDEIPSDYE